MINPIIKYYPNGNKFYEQYAVNGKLHRDPSEGPAYILYHGNGQKLLEEYCINGKFHNPYGPAYNDYVNNLSGWRLNGINYTKEVNEYLDKNNLNYKTMTKIDFNIMWTTIL